MNIWDILLFLLIISGVRSTSRLENSTKTYMILSNKRNVKTLGIYS